MYARMRFKREREKKISHWKHDETQNTDGHRIWKIWERKYYTPHEWNKYRADHWTVSQGLANDEDKRAKRRSRRRWWWIKKRNPKRNEETNQAPIKMSGERRQLFYNEWKTERERAITDELSVFLLFTWPWPFVLLICAHTIRAFAVYAFISFVWRLICSISFDLIFRLIKCWMNLVTHKLRMSNQMSEIDQQNVNEAKRRRNIDHLVQINEKFFHYR